MPIGAPPGEASSLDPGQTIGMLSNGRLSAFQSRSLPSLCQRERHTGATDGWVPPFAITQSCFLMGATLTWVPWVPRSALLHCDPHGCLSVSASSDSEVDQVSPEIDLAVAVRTKIFIDHDRLPTRFQLQALANKDTDS